VESSCEFGIEPSGSMKCWETIEWPNIYHLASYLMGTIDKGWGSYTLCGSNDIPPSSAKVKNDGPILLWELTSHMNNNRQMSVSSTRLVDFM
jgi:hypothetical protein